MLWEGFGGFEGFGLGGFGLGFGRVFGSNSWNHRQDDVSKVRVLWNEESVAGLVGRFKSVPLPGSDPSLTRTY